MAHGLQQAFSIFTIQHLKSAQCRTGRVLKIILATTERLNTLNRFHHERTPQNQGHRLQAANWSKAWSLVC